MTELKEFTGGNSDWAHDGDDTSDSDCDEDDTADAITSVATDNKDDQKMAFKIPPPTKKFLVVNFSIIESVRLESVMTGADVPLRTLFCQGPAVITFLRRFG
eukprot:m.30392 g.30392  ORF g.30392 m.30392 type:complete len:102 (+) comp16276_c0_seq1:230-535(+)